jgi:hypothetical protein
VLVADGPGATVHDDGEADTLTGNNGLDWFFANLNGAVLDVITDLDEDEETDDV